MKALLYEHQEAEKGVQFILNQIDAEKVLGAEHILEVDGLYSNAGSDRATALEKAIVALLDGGGLLFREYVGTKSYDRWHGQYSGHPYGYGPSHGSIIFSIGLTRPVRTPRKPSGEAPPSHVAALRKERQVPRSQFL